MIKQDNAIRIEATKEMLAVMIENEMWDAWRVSRPNDALPDVWDVLAVDAPILEFANTKLEIHAPILVREVMASQRNHIMWAQTSRVQDLTDWPIYNIGTTSENSAFIASQHTAMLALQAEGKPQDTYRQRLPLSYMTTWSQIMTWRDLVRWNLYFAKLAGVAADPCVKSMFNNMANRFNHIVVGTLALLPGNPKTVEKARPDAIIKPFEFMQRLERWPLFGNGSSVYRKDGIITLARNISYALRAQLVRHRGILVLDELRHRISTAPRLSTHLLSAEMNAIISAPVDTWRELIKKRTCWIAQADIWSELLTSVQKVMDDEPFLNLLPCSDGVCPFKADAALRLAGKDPGPPCPRHMQLHAPGCFVVTDAVSAALHAQVNTNPSPKARDFWRDEIINIQKG